MNIAVAFDNEKEYDKLLLTLNGYFCLDWSEAYLKRKSAIIINTNNLKYQIGQITSIENLQKSNFTILKLYDETNN